MHRFELARFPKEESKRKKLREDVGHDAHAVLQDCQTPQTLQTLREVVLLRQKHARQKGLVPSEHCVDQGYTSGMQGTEILGLVPGPGGWQATEHNGYAVTNFVIDWD